MRLAGVVVLVVLGAVAPHTQSRPAFEVASIRRNTSGDTKMSFGMPPAAPTISLVNLTIRALIREAYSVPFGMERYTLIAGSDSLLDPADPIMSARFDIQAKVPDGAPPGQQRLMLQTLLADRFKLRVHRETRELPVFALTRLRADRLGPSLEPSEQDCNAFMATRSQNPDAQSPRTHSGQPYCIGYDFSRPGIMSMLYAGPMEELARRVQGFVDRPVVDATGVTGSVEWTLAFSSNPDAAADVPEIFTAVQEQLGLKLEPRTAPFEVLVVDSVDLPTPN